MAHQWHPPPPPQYGPPFQYQPQAQNASQPQFQYGLSAPSSSIRPQYAYPPPANQARFDANNQIPSPNSVPPQYSAAAFNPALFHQFASSSLPPPPLPSFPPLPIHSANFPFIQPPLVSNNSPQNPFSPHGQPTLQNLQQRQYIGLEQANITRHGPSQVTQGQATDFSEGQPGAGPNGTAPIPEHSYQPTRGTLERQESETAAAASSEGGDSVSSYNPPSATPPESLQPNAAKTQEAQSGKVGIPSKYQGRGAFEMRELAKGALLSLAPHNIKFSDLTAEGIDTQLLSQLFEEVGLKTTTTVAPKASTTNGSLAVDPPKAAQLSSKPSPVTSLPVHMLVKPVTPSVPALLTISTIAQNGKPFKNTIVSTEAPQTLPAPTPAMERKDRIAALLAAKTGKPILRKDSPGIGSPNLPTKVSSTPLAVVSNAPETQPQSVRESPAQVIVQPITDPPASKAAPKPKNMAQTELVRQKMEQLRRETLAKAQVQEASQPVPLSSASPSTSGLANGVSTYSQPGLPPKPVLDERVQGDSHKTRNNAGSAPLTAAFSSIPGLFMMYSEPDPVPSAILNDTVTVKSTSASEASRVSQSQRPAALDLRTLSRESSGSRVPSKRPLAADAFDEEEMPPAKKALSRPTASRGQEATPIDNNSDDFSEGEIMEIDEDSPVSPLPKAPGARGWPVNGKVAAAWPSAGNHIPPNSYQQASSLATTPSEQQERKEAEENRIRQQSSISSPGNTTTTAKFPDPVSLSATDAVLVSTSKQHRPRGPVIPDIIGQAPAGVQSVSQSPSAIIDRVQREKELREKLLRDRLQRKNKLKESLPELDKEVQKTQSRQAEAQARLARLRLEAEKREEEAREARKREQEILEEVKRLEQQLESGFNGQQQFSQEIQILDQQTNAPIPATAEPPNALEPTTNEIQPAAAGKPPASYLDEENSVDASHTAENYDEQPEIDARLESGDSVSDSEDEPLRQNYNNRQVRPSAEAALPTAAEEEAFLEPPVMDDSVSEEEYMPEMDMSQREVEASSGRDSHANYDDSPMEVDSDSDGSASMSDSGSEDYQPAEPIVSNAAVQPSDEEEDDYDPMDAPISGSQNLLPDEEQDEYEPSEILDSLEVQAPLTTAGFPQTGSPASDVAASENEQEHGDDREHGLELTEANTLTNSKEVLASLADAADTNKVRTSPLPSDRLTSSRPLVHLNVPLLLVSPRMKVP